MPEGKGIDDPFYLLSPVAGGDGNVVIEDDEDEGEDQGDQAEPA